MSCVGADSTRLERFASGFSLEMAEPYLPSEAVAAIARRHRRRGSRDRALPCELVAWLVVAAGLWRSLSVDNVLSLLGRSLAARQRWVAEGLRPPGSGAISRARRRLGVRPLRRIFEHMVSRWLGTRGADARWRGLFRVALDGTTLRMPDTAANRRHFGEFRSGPKLRPASYPILKAVFAVCSRTHVVLASAVGRSSDSEWTLVRRVLRRLPHCSLALLDRGFTGNALMRQIVGAGHEFVVRAREKRTAVLERTIGRDDRIVRLPVRRGRGLHGHVTVREVRYERPGFRQVVLFTSLLDHEAFPAEEIVGLYRQRWECEIAFDELKTHLVGRHVHLRSCSPSLVCQEVDGLLVAHNLVRMHMEAAAGAAGLPPSRMGYTASVARLREAAICMARAPATHLPRMMRDLVAGLATFVLPPRRPRSYPRAIKALPSRYPIRARDDAA